MSDNRIIWLSPDDPPGAFPPVETAFQEPDGLLAAGGDLSQERLLYAYRHGIFPWYDEGQPILWWAPDPRCVLLPREFHLARRLRRQILASSWHLTFNERFDAVIDACAAARSTQPGTWITPQMRTAYTALHRDGWAHSLEVVADGRLIGGIYGLAIGRVFFGESMFSLESNASKIAMFGACRLLTDAGFELIDCQVVSSHLLTLGAKTIPRREFNDILERACSPETRLDSWPNGAISARDLLHE